MTADGLGWLGAIDNPSRAGTESRKARRRRSWVTFGSIEESLETGTAGGSSSSNSPKIPTGRRNRPRGMGARRQSRQSSTSHEHMPEQTPTQWGESEWISTGNTHTWHNAKSTTAVAKTGKAHDGKGGSVQRKRSDKNALQMLDWYVDNDCVEELGPENAAEIIGCCKDRVWELSQSAQYCRLIQHVLQLVDEQGQVALVSELKTRVVEATMDPHANHVLQRAIELMRPSVVNFALEEIMQHEKGVTDIARHRYGCRVLERLIEHFPHHQIAGLIEDLTKDANLLVLHPFGNFVMQHIFEHGSDDQRRQLIQYLVSSEEDLKNIAGHQHACSVLDKAMSYVPPKDQLALARKVLEVDGLYDMAAQRGGFAATQRLFKVAEEDSRLFEEARSKLADRREDLLTLKHGRALLAQVYPEILDQRHVTKLPSPSRSRGNSGNSGNLTGRGQR